MKKPTDKALTSPCTGSGSSLHFCLQKSLQRSELPEQPSRPKIERRRSIRWYLEKQESGKDKTGLSRSLIHISLQMFFNLLLHLFRPGPACLFPWFRRSSKACLSSKHGLSCGGLGRKPQLGSCAVGALAWGPSQPWPPCLFARSCEFRPCCNLQAELLPAVHILKLQLDFPPPFHIPGEKIYNHSKTPTRKIQSSPWYPNTMDIGRENVHQSWKPVLSNHLTWQKQAVQMTRTVLW